MPRELILGPTSHYFYSQRLKLHYVDWGNPEAPPLLLVHGGRDHCRNWDWVAEDLRNDYHIIAPDLRGHGDSEWIGAGGYYHFADYAAVNCEFNFAFVNISVRTLGTANSNLRAGLENVSGVASAYDAGQAEFATDDRAVTSATPAISRLRRCRRRAPTIRYRPARRYRLPTPPGAAKARRASHSSSRQRL